MSNIICPQNVKINYLFRLFFGPVFGILFYFHSLYFLRSYIFCGSGKIVAGKMKKKITVDFLLQNAMREFNTPKCNYIWMFINVLQHITYIDYILAIQSAGQPASQSVVQSSRWNEKIFTLKNDGFVQKILKYPSLYHIWIVDIALCGKKFCLALVVFLLFLWSSHC